MIDVFYYVQRKFKDSKFFIRMTWQRLTRRDHVADHDIWGVNSVFIEKMYPYVKAFVKAKWRHGYYVLPKFYRSDDPNDYDTEAAIAEWERVLNEILFAFEFMYQEEFSNKRAKILEAKLKRQHGDWEAPIPKNRSLSMFAMSRDNGDGTSTLVGNYEDLTEEEKERLEKEHGKDWVEECAFYYDHDLHTKLYSRAMEGMKLFGEYVMAMWD